MILPAFRKTAHLFQVPVFMAMAIAGMVLTLPTRGAAPGLGRPAAWSSTAQAGEPRVEVVDCAAFAGFVESGAGVECGYLVVPENRQEPESRTIQVAYAIVKAARPPAQPDPIVFLAGGPGDSAIGSGWIEWAHDWLTTRDLILVDPRGTGYSQPSPECPWKAPLGRSVQEHPPNGEEIRAHAVAWAQQCRDLLISKGFDLTSYNSAVNAADLEDLRRALGYEQWNLYGISYGTRTALVTMRAYPEGIRSVVLDSLLPPQINRFRTGLTSTASALAALFAACKADTACNRDYPDLETKFEELLQQAEQSPIEVSARDPASGATEETWLTPDTIFNAASEMLSGPGQIQIAPLTIEQIHGGNQTSVERLSTLLVAGQNQGVFYSVLCHDGGTLFYPEEFQAVLEKYPTLKLFYAEPQGEAICEVWGAGEAQPEQHQPVQSAVPALVLTGGAYDSSTPPAFAELAASTLSHSYLYEFPAYGHAVTFFHDCPKAIMAAFLDSPTSAPGSSCTADIKERAFVTDVYLNPGAFALFLIVQGTNTWLSAAMGLVGLLFLSFVVALPVTAYRSRRQLIEGRPLANAARWILWLVALLNVTFGIGVWALVRKALAENYGWETLFGFSPASSATLFILPWLASVLTLGLLGFAFLAWKRRWWGRLERVYYTMGTLAAAAFVAFLLYARVLSL